MTRTIFPEAGSAELKKHNEYISYLFDYAICKICLNETCMRFAVHGMNGWTREENEWCCGECNKRYKRK